MDKIKLKREVRRQKALERLGTNHPACFSCGENHPHCLERHHIAGRAYDDNTIIVCRNCHRKLSDLQKDHPAPSPTPKDPVESIGHFLLGLADLLEFLMTKLREFGNGLIARVSQLAEVR